MELFDSHRKKFLRRFSLLLPLCFLILISSIFFISVSFASDETLHKEQQALENGAIRSYAMNGQYPESLDQILNDYHITYDRSRFVVEYTPNGSNLLPYISVILLSDTAGHGRGCQMKKRLITRHPVAELASLLLFGIFVLFLLLMLLFSARIYQQTVKNTNAENTLGTAVSYLTTKFRQHDTVNGIFTGKLDNLSALCFRDTLNDQDYITYIYLDQGNLKELFTSDSSSANASAGTTIAQLSDFQISESRPGFYSFELKDSEGNKETFYLHQNSVSKEAS